MRRCLLISAASLWLATLQGCSTPSSMPDLPLKPSGKGLLVARFYMPGSSIWENARIDIDGKLRDASFRDGYVTIALEPGEHQFVQLRLEGQRLAQAQSPHAPSHQVKGGGYHYYYIPGGSYTVDSTTLSVERRFNIEAGKITNLGLIVYLSADDPQKQRAAVDQTRQYYAIPVDNSAEIGYYLQTNHSTLLATLKDPTPKLAAATYLPAQKLPELRKAIASVESQHGKFINTESVSAAYGDAGTLVVIQKNAGEKPLVNVLDTGTLANIVDARRYGERLFFLTSTAKILVVDRGTIGEIDLPDHLQTVQLAVFSDDNLMVVDNRRRILISQDRGRTWAKHDGAMLEQPRSDIRLAADEEGGYIYTGSRGVPSSILYMASGASAPKAISTPQYRGESSRGPMIVVARRAGLFILSNERDFYFRPRASERWERYSKPGVECKPMGISTAGTGLSIQCDGISYESNNSGKIWEAADST